MPSDLTPDTVRAMLEGVDPNGWTYEALPPPSTKPANFSELLGDLKRPAGYVLDQGGNGTVAEVVVEADAPILTSAPDIARALLAAWEERDRLAHELAAYKRAKAENDERFMLERDEALAEVARLRAEKAPPEPPATTTHGAENQGWTWTWVPALAPDATAQDTSAAEPTTLPGWRWMPGMRALTDHRGAHGAPYRLWTGDHGAVAGGCALTPDLRALPAIRKLAEEQARDEWDAHVDVCGYRLARWHEADPGMRHAKILAHLSLLVRLDRPASRDAVARLVAEAAGLRSGMTAPRLWRSTYHDHHERFDYFVLSVRDEGECAVYFRDRGGGGSDGQPYWLPVPALAGVTDPTEALRLIAATVLGSTP